MAHRSFDKLGQPGILLALVTVFLPLSVSADPPCGTFEIVPTPDPGSSSNALVDIAAVGDGTAWAIGSQSGAGTTSGLLLYYDGLQWSENPVPSGLENVTFGAIGNTPEGDVWMVGTRSYSVYEVEVFYVRARSGAIDRIDSFLNGGGPLHISASADDDVWGVSGGLWPVDAGGYVQHFDGSGWSTTQLPAEFIYRNQPQAIYAAGPDDVWVAGYGGDGRAQYIGYVQHWDGSSWERVSTPFDGQNLTYFLSIDGSSADDIWIAGHINHAEDLLLHWDGSSWTQVAGPASSSPLQHAVAPGSGNAWASPYSLTPGSPFAYWDGSAWTDVDPLEVPGAVTVNWRGLSRGGSCDVWAVGSYHDGTTHKTLVAQLTSGGGVTSTPDALGPEAQSALRVAAHPSPFRARTQFSFEVPKAGVVSLVVYNLAGRRVATITEGTRSAGTHFVSWDASGLASGRYVYRLTSARDVATGWVTHLK